MQRQFLRVALLAAGAFSCALLSVCIRLTSEVTYFLVRSNDRATLEFAVSKPGVCIDLHGGCAEIYQLSLPAHLSVVSASAVLSYRVNYVVPLPSELPEAGEIAVAISPGRCEVSVNLFKKAGKPLAVNGNFKQSRCGQSS